MGIIAANDESALPDINPRGDTSQVDQVMVNHHVVEIVAILAMDIDEYETADRLRAYVKEHLSTNVEVYIEVNDKLARDKVLSKKQFKDYLSLALEI